MAGAIAVTANCAGCGAANPPGNGFCGTCGTGLATPAPRRVSFRGPVRLAIGSFTVFLLGALVCIAVGTQIQAQGAVSFLSPLVDLGLSAAGLEQLAPAGGSSEDASLALALLFVAAFTFAGMAAFVFVIAAMWTLVRAFRRGRQDRRTLAAQARVAQARDRAGEEWVEHGRPAVAEGVRRGREGWRAAKPRLRAAARVASRGAARVTSAAGEAVASRREERAAGVLPPPPAPLPQAPLGAHASHVVGVPQAPGVVEAEAAPAPPPRLPH